MNTQKKAGKCALALVALITLVATPATTKSITQQDVDEAFEKAKQYEGTIDTTNKHTDQMTEEAQKSYGDYQKRMPEIKMWEDRIDYQDSTITIKDKPDTPTPDQKEPTSAILAADERIYIFISSSMPKQTIENYAKAMDKLADPHIAMVLRGCIGGCEKIMPTVKWIQDIIAPTQEKQLAAEVMIDPYLFSYYAINTVPTIVYAKNVAIDVDEGSEGLPQNLTTTPKAYSVVGDVSIDYALEKIANADNSERLAEIAKKLRQGQYAP